MKSLKLILFILTTFWGSLLAQDVRKSAFEQRQLNIQNGSLSNITATNIGPTVFSGRISDISVNPQDPTEFYVAYASGGLWHTVNNGITFTPIFDNEAVMTIGDIAVDWNRQTIWVGTGEVNSSRSSYAGNGIYKSSNNGKTWTHLGLDESHHIGRIILHPTNKDIAWVAALGHLYTTNQERGIFKTTDGGKTWNKTLFINDKTGAVDLIMDPQNNNVLYAAMWERIRKAWNFEESGLGSGIYKSTDGGATWKKMNTDNSGFINNEGTGRIGLDITVKDGKSYLYAIIDNYNRRPKSDTKKTNGLVKEEFEKMTKDQFLKLKKEDLQTYLSTNGFPEKYTPTSIKSMVRKGEIKPIALKEYIETANSLLFDTQVVGAEVYLSTDGGASWKRTHTDYLDAVYNSYGYYFGQIRVDPTNPQVVYIMGVPILRSDDGGATWKNINGDNVHADHHALWINPKNPKHLINGNDGGINISYDKGENWIKCNSPSVGQFYYINVDNDEPYNVYGGTQDNGVWVGTHTYTAGERWQMTGDYPYEMIMGGDGMQVQIDNRDNNTIYTGFQYGNYFRMNKATKNRSYITPKHELGDRPYRWNWQSPILLSAHNQDILYMGSNKLLRSMNQGRDFTEISEDLTNGGKFGDVAYGTLTTISESIFAFGTIYTGSDDGKIYRTKDGGNTWIDLGAKLPKDKWVSRIQASTHNKSRVFLSLNGYRDDDFSAYVYMSDDYGNSWTDISESLPSEPVNVIKEDPEDGNILYVGTDHGTYVSLDRGKTFTLLSKDIPSVAVHDIVVQERDKHLLIGTHGRSIYKIDIAPMRKLTNLNSPLHIFDIPEGRAGSYWGNKKYSFGGFYEPKMKIDVFAKDPGNGILEVYYDKTLVSRNEITIEKGLSTISYDYTVDIDKVKKFKKCLKKETNGTNNLSPRDNEKIYLSAGEYTMVLKLNGNKATQTFKLK